MKTITKHTILALLATTAMFASCYEDKGNYTYTETEEITGDGFPDQISVVQKSDYIELNPTFTSSQNGTIDNNPNYEFGCLLWKSGGTFEDTRTRQKDINEEHAKDIKYFADLAQGDYVIQYMVTNKTTGVTTNFKVPVKVTSATYEGWMVLCDDKDGNARLDLVSRISPTRINVVTNLLGSKDPKLKGARSMYMDAYPFNYYGRNGLWYCTEHGTYTLNETTLTSQYNITSEFMVAPENEEVVELNGLSMGKMFAITDKGNIYVKSSKSGARYEDACNTFTDGGNPEFHAAPFVGVSAQRPADYLANKVLFYDMDNKQFVVLDGSDNGNSSMCSTLDDPSDKLFSYRTGRDLITMVNTTFSGSTVYSVLQDDAKQRYVYGINLSSGQITQTMYEPLTAATGVDKATTFAFHSQYPYMFYNDGDKVYSYHLINHAANLALTLPGEEVTMLKFNLFLHPTTMLSDKSEEFAAQQYQLIVGSYKTSSTDGNGGVLRFYKFDQATGTLTLDKEYEGFARIKNVMYRER